MIYIFPPFLRQRPTRKAFPNWQNIVFSLFAVYDQVYDINYDPEKVMFHIVECYTVKFNVIM